MSAAYNPTNPSEADIIAAIAKAFGAPESVAIAWLSALAVRFDAKAHAERIAAAGVTA